MQVGAQGVFVQGHQDLAVGGHPLNGLNHTLMQYFGKLDVAHKQMGAVLIADAQGIAEPLGDDQNGAFASQFQQSIGCHRRAHLDVPNDGTGNGRTSLNPQHAAHALHRRVLVVFGVFAQ